MLSSFFDFGCGVWVHRRAAVLTPFCLLDVFPSSDYKVSKICCSLARFQEGLFTGLL